MNLKNRDVWVTVGTVRAVVGPPRRRRYSGGAPQPPAWLVLGNRPPDGAPCPTVAFGSFELDDQGELERVKILNGPAAPEILEALLEAGRSQWRKR